MDEREGSSQVAAPKQDIVSMSSSRLSPREKSIPLPVSLSYPTREKEKGNLATERTRELDTQILYTIHDLPTNHGIPPTGAMQNSYQRGKENPGNGEKKPVRA